MAEVIFFIAAIGAIAGAVGTVSLRNPFFSVLALVVHLLSLAALFLLLRAQFVAAAQVIVYAGAVMVLYVFVVAYVGSDEPLGGLGGPGLRPVSMLFAGALFVELSIAVLGSGLSGLGTEGGGFFATFGSPAQIGELFLTKFLLAFEIASLLLLVAAVGAVILARRRSLDEPHEVSVAQLLRPSDPERTGSGTDTPAPLDSMAEVGGPPDR
jgi:NADH-quinone oxidoreductase subunit J